MKKALSLLLIALIAFTLVACGNNSVENSSSSQAESGTKVETDNKNSNDYETFVELPWTHEVNLTTTQYCIDTPDSLIKRSNTGHMYKVDSYFIIYDQYLDISSEEQYEVNLDEIKTAKDVIPAMSEQMAATAEKGLLYADKYTVEATTSDDVKVNSWDMCKTTGKINLTSEYPLDYESANFVAYSVIKDGYPVYFAVVERPDGEEPITMDEMSALADMTAKTFRDHPDYLS